MKPQRIANVILATVLVSACQMPELPSVAVTTPAVTDDDHAVMKAVIDQLLRPRRAATRRQAPQTTGEAAASFLVFDSTLRFCEANEVMPGGQVPGCVPATVLNEPTARLFRERSSTPLQIQGTLGHDVMYIPSAEVDTTARLGEFARQRSPGSTIVAFSMPVYPRERSAMIFCYRFWDGTGLVHLERIGDSWSVVGTSNWTQY